MSLLNHLFGNASEVNINELKNEFGDILIPEEEIVAAFVLASSLRGGKGSKYHN